MTTITTETSRTKDGKKITFIPATKSLHPEQDGVTPIRRKRRVAAYCRVSTTLEEQQGSYERQKDYYTKLITSNPEFELAGVYGDEGKSGTSMRGRTGFLEMMDDVRAGKIDYIITKATSRFGRNVADFLKILDELDSYGVEVLFESEGILTSGQQNRTMLQVIGATNEHYSSSLSNNVRWAKERNMKAGKVVICYKNFLGYEKGEDGKPKIVEEEAKIVRLIYEMFLEGKSYSFIADHLTEQGIPTPRGKEIWRSNSVKSILTNEKYTGDALLQKTFKRNFLDKRGRKNNGEKPQVLVEKNHPAIVDKATFDRAQELVRKRQHIKDRGACDQPFTRKLVCKDCGEYFGHKIWNSRGNIKYSMWVCNHKYSEETSYGGKKCKAANLRQEWVEQGYLYTMNQLLARRSEIMGKYERMLDKVDARLKSKEIEKGIKTLDEESTNIHKELKAMAAEEEFHLLRNNEFNHKMNELKIQMEEVTRSIRTLEEERLELNSNKKMYQTIIKAIDAMPDKLTVFHDKDFINTVEQVEVSQYVLKYQFYGGESVKVNIELLKDICYDTMP